MLGRKWFPIIFVRAVTRLRVNILSIRWHMHKIGGGHVRVPYLPHRRYHKCYKIMLFLEQPFDEELTSRSILFMRKGILHVSLRLCFDVSFALLNFV